MGVVAEVGGRMGKREGDTQKTGKNGGGGRSDGEELYSCRGGNMERDGTGWGGVGRRLKGLVGSFANASGALFFSVAYRPHIAALALWSLDSPGIQNAVPSSFFPDIMGTKMHYTDKQVGH